MRQDGSLWASAETDTVWQGENIALTPRGASRLRKGPHHWQDVSVDQPSESL